ncbi:hypothetical protein BX666DRAFT_2027070 [Dichotomocladium elegans]|nr:hypothetical protein BX666DRAFT_2027070 [Dichotomocladium elegans]
MENQSNNHNEKPTVTDAFKTIKLEDFKDVGKIPCARNSLLYGMGAGLGLGSIRFFVKRSVPSAANWAVAAFCGVSAIAFEMCQMDRKQKLEKLHLIVKESNSRGQHRRTVVDESGANGAFHVVIDTPSAPEEEAKEK